MSRIAIVTPWYGADLKGGAEQQARQISLRLHERGHEVVVLTTCCKDFFHDWSHNHHKPGLSSDNGITVHRFPVAKRNQPSFDRLNTELLALPQERLIPGVPPVTPELGSVWARENINSPRLYRHLRHKGKTYGAIIFIPYLYGPTVNGLPEVAERAWLQPCLHDEAYAYLPVIENAFHQAKGILYNSEGEKLLAAKLYGPAVLAKGTVVGEGIELDNLQIENASVPEDVAGRRYFLFLGRRDATKGLDFLVKAFKLYQSQNSFKDVALVLAGPGNNSYHAPEDHIIDLGLISENHKAGLLQNSLALLQPSVNESFSRVLFEAWICSRPVIVHSDCLATSYVVRKSGGGWLAKSLDEWANCIKNLLEKSKHEIDNIGKLGNMFALEHTDWDRVMDLYERELHIEAHKSTLIHPSRKLNSIHQILPNLSYGDAISNAAIYIRTWLRELGYSSDIIVQHLDPRLHSEAIVYNEAPIAPSSGLIYHHSIGTNLTKAAQNHPGPKCLIFHNITPGSFFEPYRPDYANILESGVKKMRELAKSFTISYGVSRFNSQELREYGFDSPEVLPLAIDPMKWDFKQDARLKAMLTDGNTNIIFVGRIAPNKCQHHLVEWFADYLSLDPSARLIIVGGYELNDPYYLNLEKTIRAHKLSGNILLTGVVDDSKLATLYSSAHLFVSMSEHEGFCVPLIESMWFDVPVLAYKSTAIPETLGKAAMMFTSKYDFPAVAALAYLMVFDEAIREKVLEAQYDRRETYLPATIKNHLHNLVTKLEKEA